MPSTTKNFKKGLNTMKELEEALAIYNRMAQYTYVDPKRIEAIESSINKLQQLLKENSLNKPYTTEIVARQGLRSRIYRFFTSLFRINRPRSRRKQL